MEILNAQQLLSDEKEGTIAMVKYDAVSYEPIEGFYKLKFSQCIVAQYRRRESKNYGAFVSKLILKINKARFANAGKSDDAQIKKFISENAIHLLVAAIEGEYGTNCIEFEKAVVPDDLKMDSKIEVVKWFGFDLSELMIERIKVQHPFRS